MLTGGILLAVVAAAGTLGLLADRLAQRIPFAYEYLLASQYEESLPEPNEVTHRLQSLADSLAAAMGVPDDMKIIVHYVDEDTAIVTSKSRAGRDRRALERPGLWNGAMARWNTIFVEVPLATFTPVKSVLDLLRPEHQPPQE